MKNKAESQASPLTAEDGQTEELLALLADLDAELTPPASFHENVMRSVRAEAGRVNVSQTNAAQVNVARVNAARAEAGRAGASQTAAGPWAVPGTPESPAGPGRQNPLFRRLGLGTLLPVAACLLVLVLAAPRFFSVSSSAPGGADGSASMRQYSAMNKSADMAETEKTFLLQGASSEMPMAMDRPAEPAAGEAGLQADRLNASDIEKGSTEQVSRKIIRNGSIELLVDSFDQAAEKLKSAAAEWGGYVVSQNCRQGQSTKVGGLSIKVPYDRFEDLLAMARDLGKATNEQVDTQDVTSEYIDLTARIQVYKTKLNRLLELLERSGDLSQVLAVENELASTRAELESLEGQLRYLNSQTSYSTLWVDLRERSIESSQVQLDGFAGFWQDLRESFVMGVNDVIKSTGRFFVALAGWLPALAGCGAVGLLLWQVWLKKRWKEYKR